jgi:energy-coupling factor transporter ATP-binding protein EcfA2
LGGHEYFLGVALGLSLTLYVVYQLFCRVYVLMERYALVIGIGQYDGMQPLSKPAGDAIAVEQVLKRAGWRVTCLNDRVTYDALEKVLKTFLERQAAGQDALIYFTGHGFMVEESRYEQRGYLATSDCAIECEGETIVAQRRALSFSYLNGLIREARLSSLVVLLDCCHGGLFVEDGLVKQSFQASPDQNFCWIAACRSFQQAYARGSESHSLFTGALLVGLAESGAVTVLSVLRYINVAFGQLSLQEPIYIGAGKDIPLISPKLEALIGPTMSAENPYQGLQAFTKETQQFFFGRDAVVNDLVLKLQEASFVPLFGASGSGKSSVVRAGLVPRLEEMGWQVLGPMKPGPEPIVELKRSFDAVFERRQLGAIYQQIEAEGLKGIVAQLPAKRYLLVIDQFEEVFTLCEDRAKQRQFIELLMGLEVDDRLSIVTTMRSDFVEAWQSHGALVEVLHGDTVWIPPLEGNELRDAIIKPSQVQGYEFESGLEMLIFEDVQEEPNCLPLLEFVLSELWHQRDLEKLQITVTAYLNVGRLVGALNKYATDWYEERLNAQEQKLVQRVMLELVRFGMDAKDTRWRRCKSDLINLGEEASEIVNILVEQRLLVIENDKIDLAHERLMDGWELFAKWRLEDRDLRRLAQRITDAYQEWITENEDEDFFMRSGLLKQAQSNWFRLNTIFHNQEIINFFERSLEIEYQKTSYHDSIKKFKNSLKSMQKNLADRVESISNLEATLSVEMVAEIQGEISDFMARTKVFEDRMIASRRNADWIECNHKKIVVFLEKYIGDRLSVINFQDLSNTKKELRKLLNWLKDSLLAGQPLTESLPELSGVIPSELYAASFMSLAEMPDLTFLELIDFQEILLYLEYLSDALIYID